jgi:hypothetical protein
LLTFSSLYVATRAPNSLIFGMSPQSEVWHPCPALPLLQLTVSSLLHTVDSSNGS